MSSHCCPFQQFSPLYLCVLVCCTTIVAQPLPFEWEIDHATVACSEWECLPHLSIKSLKQPSFACSTRRHKLQRGEDCMLCSQCHLIQLHQKQPACICARPEKLCTFHLCENYCRHGKNERPNRLACATIIVWHVQQERACKRKLTFWDGQIVARVSNPSLVTM
jgi:hypothetical protein